MINRIYFIDIIRAFAILMMLQGHFIDTLLDNSYRNLNSEVFLLWSFLRGITAPLFFTISGLIFTYLMLKANEKGYGESRMKKGFLRGLYLIAIGYFIRINFLDWFSGYFNKSFLVIDVLQCIGLSLIIVVSVFFICNKNNILFLITSLILGIIIFLLEPLYKSINIEVIPDFIHNYISRNNGSVFSIIPWYGYTSTGSFIAILFYWFLHKKYFKVIIISSFICTGLFLIYNSSNTLMFLFHKTDINVFRDAAYNNYLFTKLGYVLIYFAFFYLLEKYLKYPLILKIGKNTLPIYIIHFIILYGSFFRFGLKNFGRILSPIEAVFSVLLFLVVIIYLSFNYKKLNLVFIKCYNKISVYFKLKN